mgnify:CR=1 FL=1
MKITAQIFSFLIVFGNRNISFQVPQREQEDWEKRLNFVV